MKEAQTNLRLDGQPFGFIVEQARKHYPDAYGHKQ